MDFQSRRAVLRRIKFQLRDFWWCWHKNVFWLKLWLASRSQNIRIYSWLVLQNNDCILFMIFLVTFLGLISDLRFLYFIFDNYWLFFNFQYRLLTFLVVFWYDFNGLWLNHFTFFCFFLSIRSWYYWLVPRLAHCLFLLA